MKYVLDKYFEKTKGFYPFFKYCPPQYHDYYICKRASLTLGYKYNWKEPKTLNEKIRWLIYNERLKSKSILTDKIKVKAYITESIGSGHCSQIYGIWNNFNSIDFSSIPNKFALKTNHAWNTSLFIHNKKYVLDNRKYFSKVTSKWLKIKYEEYSLEPQYKDIEPHLFIEYLIPFDNEEKFEYQVHCFNSNPLMIEVFKETENLTFYDKDWNILKYKLKNDNSFDKIKRPLFLEEMLDYAKILSNGFSYVRVDFVVSNSNLQVLEMTFTPHSAIIPFSNVDFDIELGEMLELPKSITA